MRDEPLRFEVILSPKLVHDPKVRNNMIALRQNPKEFRRQLLPILRKLTTDEGIDIRPK